MQRGRNSRKRGAKDVQPRKKRCRKAASGQGGGAGAKSDYEGVVVGGGGGNGDDLNEAGGANGAAE